MRKSQQSLLAVVTSVALLAAPLTVRADDPKPPKPMTVDGVDGIWFRAESAKRFLLLDEENKTLKLQLDRQKKVTSLAKEEIDLTVKLKDNALQIADLRGQQLGEEVERRQSAEKQRDAWYRSPTLWFAIGVVVATGGYVALDRN